METTLHSILKRIEESVEQIKQSGLTDTDATNNLIEQAQNLLSIIKVIKKYAKLVLFQRLKKFESGCEQTYSNN
jgi:hypothetical protein